MPFTVLQCVNKDIIIIILTYIVLPCGITEQLLL